jgi:hypothetical protein
MDRQWRPLQMLPLQHSTTIVMTPCHSASAQLSEGDSCDHIRHVRARSERVATRSHRRGTASVNAGDSLSKQTTECSSSLTGIIDAPCCVASQRPKTPVWLPDDRIGVVCLNGSGVGLAEGDMPLPQVICRCVVVPLALAYGRILAVVRRRIFTRWVVVHGRVLVA